MSLVASELAQATWPVIRSLLARASDDGRRRSGVLGIRARPAWSGPTEQKLGDLTVTITPCVSALAVREALLARGDEGWLVVLTDRSEADLGTGITSHFHQGTLRNPDPWEAVRDQFGATRLDRCLVTHPQAREIAQGILAARGDVEWPQARGGFLTMDHLCSVVAVRQLGFPEIDGVVTAEDVISWAADTGRATLLDDLTRLAGEALVAQVISWMAAQCGSSGPLVERLLVRGRVDDLAPLGLAGRAVLGCERGTEPWVLLRVQQLDNLPDVTAGQLTALVHPAEDVTRTLIGRRDDPAARQTGRILARADALVAEMRAGAGVDGSDLLRAGLTSRLAAVGDLLKQATASGPGRAKASGVDAQLVDGSVMPAVEDAFDRVRHHALADHPDELRVTRAFAGVRLVRWLALDVTAPTSGFLDMMRRHRDVDAWVDRAYADAWRGVDDESLAQGLKGVIEATKLRRDSHDLVFAESLRSAPSVARAADVIAIEDVLGDVVVPIANDGRSVLLIVADGMSAAIGTEIVDDIEGRYDTWLECVPEKVGRRGVVVAALPSLTEVSRCSLLSGRLSRGSQEAERTGFAAYLKAHRLSGALFHKLSLEQSGGGALLSPEVGAAVDDLDGVQVVACVLNTIDDALDRSDPGIDWTADAVTHLRPLLDRARRAGRTVVLTSDHGHVIERREGRTLTVAEASSNRSHAAAGATIGPGEVRVTGPRVLLHDGDAVLAVDESLRYGPLKAGYHGGAAPAEVVVPLHVLAPYEPPRGWQIAAPQMPAWWNQASAILLPAPAAVVPTFPKGEHPSLFDEPVTAPDKSDLVAKVLASPVYADQRKRGNRVPLSDDQVANLLRVLAAASDNRLDPDSVASALGVGRVQLNGALPMVQRLLNVEQYPVLERDADGTTVVLNMSLLKEQFGISR